MLPKQMDAEQCCGQLGNRLQTLHCLVGGPQRTLSSGDWPFLSHSAIAQLEDEQLKTFQIPTCRI